MLKPFSAMKRKPKKGITPDTPSEATNGPQVELARKKALALLYKEMEESVPRQFGQTAKSS